MLAYVSLETYYITISAAAMPSECRRSAALTMRGGTVSMPLSDQIRRLTARWEMDTNWPQRLDWIEIQGLRGWTGQRFEFRYPIMAVVGENGVGKSTVLQAAASVYKSKGQRFRWASDFFPSTVWDEFKGEIKYQFRQGDVRIERTIRKPGDRWRGNPQRPERRVAYIDLTRIQPIIARVGYTKIVKTHHKEDSSVLFDKDRLERFSQVMGRPYRMAKMALTDADAKRQVPVLAQQEAEYSGFHQGQGETTIAELLEADMPPYSLLLIDEIESSLHPRAQRRLIRDLAEKCREREWQIVLTTHSPYVLEELPPQARAYIMQLGSTREIIYGVSPRFAMTKMDDYAQHECDLYVEDVRAQIQLAEVLVVHAPNVIERCQIIPYGAASVGKALGQMVINNRFPRPSRVFLDGDQGPAPGCVPLPGDDAPERVVFGMLRAKNWDGIPARVGRDHAKVADACGRAMAISNHHEWVDDAATKLTLRGDTLWQAMCAEWAKYLPESDARKVTQPIEDALIGVSAAVVVVTPPATAVAAAGLPAPPVAVTPQPKPARASTVSSATLPLFAQLSDAPEE